MEPPTAGSAASAKPAAALMQTEPWEDELALALGARFGSDLMAAAYRGQAFCEVSPAVAHEVVEWLRAEDFSYLVDLTAVDYPARERRFELLYILYRFRDERRVRVKTTVAEGEEPRSVVDVFAGSNWLEREVFDMFGIRFAGHPDMRRMLLPEDWQGYPLRKEYPITGMDQDWVRKHIGIESGQ